MSRGLGSMERAILENLDAVRLEGLHWHGGYNTQAPMWAYWVDRRRGWVNTSGVKALLPPHIYDLRAVARLLANKRGLKHITGPFQASFSRAVKSLIRKGLLEVPPGFVTYEEPHGYRRRNGMIEEWRGGEPRQRVIKQTTPPRFVVSGLRCFIEHPSYWQGAEVKPKRDKKAREKAIAAEFRSRMEELRRSGVIRELAAARLAELKARR